MVSTITNGYVLLVFFLISFFMKEGYYEIGQAKYESFFVCSVIYLIVVGLLHTWQLLGKKEEREGNLCASLFSFTVLDKAVLFYGLWVFLSFCFSSWKKEALWGAPGWNMGLVTQLLLVALYFAVSRTIKPTYEILFGVVGIQYVVFLLGILHRFQIDPLGLYVYNELTIPQKQQFLSSVGQATWYSSYLCVLLGLELYGFLQMENRKLRKFCGGALGISFASLVTQNSDSAFFALFVLLCFLGAWATYSYDRLHRFVEMNAILWGSFLGIGLLQRIFPERMVPLEALSIFFSQSVLPFLLFCITMVFLMVADAYAHAIILKGYRIFYKIVLGLAVVAVVGSLLFLWLGTKGKLENLSLPGYFYFHDRWGSGRGIIWRLTWESFLEFPLWKKLIGTGPDTFATQIYAVEATGTALRNVWGDSTWVSNAHNEFLNITYTLGLGGLISWFFLLAAGIKEGFTEIKGRDSFWLAAALCVLGYAGHNLFCYAQVCATPFLFLILAVARSRKS
ncbi:MAG: O-antigen ligase family protein [Lachnospiraceae bacterium]|nr:O-antigen ligase family protein [Lachnospiraceae bacterium]